MYFVIDMQNGPFVDSQALMHAKRIIVSGCDWVEPLQADAFSPGGGSRYAVQQWS